MKRTVRAATASVFLAGCFLLTGAVPALAAGSGSIDHVQNDHGIDHVLFSIAGLPKGTRPDLSSVRVTVGGETVNSSAGLASASTARVNRVAVLALDVSNSMRGKAFGEARRAAHAFINHAPADVEIGLVTFAGSVETVQKPTRDHARLSSEIDALQLSHETHLYQGVLTALTAAGTQGQRRVLVLSDGRDTTGSALSAVTKAVRDSGSRVDVVSLGQTIAGQSPLSRVAQAGEGTLVNAADPTALTALFTDEAQALASQLLVSFKVPTGNAGSSAELTVSLAADGTVYSDDAFVSLGDSPASQRGTTPSTAPLAVSAPRFVVSGPIFLGAVAALALVLIIGLALAFGVFRSKEETSLERRLAGYGRRDPAKLAPLSAQVNVKDSALALAQKALGGGFDVKLAKKLDAAGISLRPAEWVLAHAGCAVGAALLGLLLGSGSPVFALLMLAAGVVAPWLYLGFKQARRIKAFNAQLAETLQLMAGGLSAGLSFAQSVDTIVREGTEPVCGEFRRALIEARLGVDIEDALDGVAARMGSADFEWVVMAVRIQREVGGNLAELLVTVSSTLREREHLRRQVQNLVR